MFESQLNSHGLCRLAMSLTQVPGFDEELLVKKVASKIKPLKLSGFGSPADFPFTENPYYSGSSSSSVYKLLEVRDAGSFLGPTAVRSHLPLHRQCTYISTEECSTHTSLPKNPFKSLVGIMMGQKWDKRTQDTICVASRDKYYLDMVFKNMKKLFGCDFAVRSEYITDRIGEKIKKGKFRPDEFVILVGTVESRGMIISKDQQSQLGSIYEHALNVGAKLFIIIAGGAVPSIVADLVQNSPILHDYKYKENKLIILKSICRDSEDIFSGEDIDILKNFLHIKNAIQTEEATTSN